MIPNRPLLELAASDLMSHEVTTVPEWMSLRDAAHILRRAGVGGAPVVDSSGRCVGVISAFDFLRWAEGDRHRIGAEGGPHCPYLVKRSPTDGADAWLCVLAEGGCPFQAPRPDTGGRHVSLCLRAAAGDWHGMENHLPDDAVRGYMTPDVVTADTRMKLPELAGRMVTAGVQRLIVVDEVGKPVGVITSSRLLSALAGETAAACEAT